MRGPREKPTLPVCLWQRYPPPHARLRPEDGIGHAQWLPGRARQRPATHNKDAAMGFSHWDFFRDIETAFRDHTQTIGYTSQYYAVHTPRLSDLIVSSCEGFLTTAALLCKAVDPARAYKTLDDCRPVIAERFPGFTALKVVLPSYVMSLAPWEGWGENRPPPVVGTGLPAPGKGQGGQQEGGQLLERLVRRGRALLRHPLLPHGAVPRRARGPGAGTPGLRAQAAARLQAFAFWLDLCPARAVMPMPRARPCVNGLKFPP